MPTSLRAFLMLRSGTGDWSVEVFRALEELTEAWKVRPDPDHVTAIIHIGFNRPPSREFDECAQRFQGKTLVTAAAKYALPSDFHTSRRDVGEAATLPLFVGTRGWGGSDVADEEPAPIRPASPAKPAATGWIADFLIHRPEVASALEASGVWDDDSYLRRESELPRELRRDAGIARFQHLIGTEGDDPGAVARAVPPWLANREFETMDLPVRVSNCFTNMDISKVSDLASYSLNTLLSVPNFGRKSVSDLLDQLGAALEEGPFSVAAQIEHAADISLLAGIRRSLLKYPDREREIIRRRMGLDALAETLQQIGEDYGVTRERIRQIEAKTVRRLRQEEFWDDLLTQKLSMLLRDREFPLPALGVEAADRWFVGIAEYPSVLRYILTNICDNRAGIVSIDNVEYLSFLNQERWESTQREARRLLESSVERRWSRSHCRSVIEGLLPESAREFRSLLWEKATSLCHFVADVHGVEYLTAYGRGAEHIVEAVLEASEHPLHYTEIAALASARAGREIEIRRAHNAAAAVGLLLGRGTYGVERHISLDREEMGRLAEEADEVVADGQPGRQWHASEILAMLVERGSHFSSIADKYIVDVALNQSGSLDRLGRLVWASRDEDHGNEVARIDVRQAVIALLQQAGRPLRPRDIRQRLLAIRGTDQNFQIAVIDPLVRVATGLWGLNDRDISVKRAEQPELLEEVVKLLRTRSFALHASEITGTFIAEKGLSAATIFSLAAADPRMRVNGSQDLYLTEWGGPRRESISEAVPKVLATAGSGIRFDDLVEQVGARVRRACDRTAISACLQALEATLDRTSGRWSLPANDVDEFALDDEAEAPVHAAL
jgi:hypothetical protein